MGWKRLSSAASDSMCLRYSSSVVAPMTCSSPRDVHRRSRRARADQHVDFIYEEDRARLLELVNDAFKSLFELAAVHRSGHERADVQLEQAFVHQRRGDVALHDALGESLHDGGLADARLADEGRIVLGAARQDLDDALDLHLPPDDRVEFFLFGFARQVGGELVHQGSLLPGLAGTRGLGRPGRSRRGRRLVEDAAGLPADLVGRYAEAAQHVHGRVVHADERQQDVFGADVVMPEAAGFVHRKFEDLLRIGGEVNFVAREPSGRGNALDHFANARGFQSEFPQHASRHPAVFIREAEQEVFGANVVLTGAFGFAVSET